MSSTWPPGTPSDGCQCHRQLPSTRTDTNPVSIVVDPALGRYVYTANFLGNSISGFRIDPNCGQPELAQATPYPTGTKTNRHRLHPARQPCHPVGYAVAALAFDCKSPAAIGWAFCCTGSVAGLQCDTRRDCSASASKRFTKAIVRLYWLRVPRLAHLSGLYMCGGRRRLLISAYSPSLVHVVLFLRSLRFLPLHAAPPPAHDQFQVAVYIPVFVVEKMKDPALLESSWKRSSSQVAVDKVYIETYRSGTIADDAVLETVKNLLHRARRSGCRRHCLCRRRRHRRLDESDDSEGQFVSMCYTDPKQRDYVKQIAELTARHFDEIMLDDFFFNNTKRDSDIAAKGDQSWTDFRLKLMDDVSRDLVLGPARAVNPKVKVIIKFPNWYEHFQANGYDLDQEPKMFDGIYTGTETRDPVITDQHLQQYESYMIVRYFDNIAPRAATAAAGSTPTTPATSIATPSSCGTRCWPRRRRSCSSSTAT